MNKANYIEKLQNDVQIYIYIYLKCLCTYRGGLHRFVCLVLDIFRFVSSFYLHFLNFQFCSCFLLISCRTFFVRPTNMGLIQLKLSLNETVKDKQSFFALDITDNSSFLLVFWVVFPVVLVGGGVGGDDLISSMNLLLP